MKTIDEQVLEHAANTPGGLTVAKRNLLKAALLKEDAFWERYVANEEKGQNNRLLDCE